MTKRHMNEKGLTLIELLAVLVILGIIAAIAVPAIGNIIENTKIRAAMADVEAIETASWYHYLDTGEFPKSNVSGFEMTQWHTDGQCLFVTGKGDRCTVASNWGGPYLEAWPIPPFSDDPNENAYAYRYVAEDSNFYNNRIKLAISENSDENIDKKGFEFINIRFNSPRFREEYEQDFIDRFGEDRIYVYTEGSGHTENENYIWIRIFR